PLYATEPSLTEPPMRSTKAPASLDGTRPRPGHPDLAGPAGSALPLKAPSSRGPIEHSLAGLHPALYVGSCAIGFARREGDLLFANGVAAAVGRTPLIKLKRASEETGCTILGKAEFMNPGQSVKDRAALFIIQDAVKRGTLRPGGTVVEGTAGNTGIGLTVVG